MLETIFDPIFNPLLSIGAFWGVLIISLIISLVMTVIYKFTTDQHVMKELKSQLKKFQDEMKALRDNPSQMMDVQKKAMQTNMEYMKHSFKPMIFSFLPIILIFGWLSTNLAYEPLLPGETFNVSVVFQPGVSGNASVIVPEGFSVVGDNVSSIIDSECPSFLWFKNECKKAGFTIKPGEVGEYDLTFAYGNETQTKTVLITNKQDYLSTSKLITGDATFSQIDVQNKPMYVFKIGTFGLNWFWAYFIFSIVFTTGLRKVMNVH